MSTTKLEALSCISDRPVEALLLGRDGENDEPVAEPNSVDSFKAELTADVSGAHAHS